MTSREIPTNLQLPVSRTPRSSGVHVSSIIRCLATEMGILKPEWAEELSLTDIRSITDPVAVLRISIGLAWEEWYIPTILGPLGVVDHPGEMFVDGIYMTHDGESLNVIITDRRKQHVVVVHEIKATYKSTNTVGDVLNEAMYLMQIKSYCKGAGTTRAQIHILFLCGDYTYPIKPILKCWELEFTPREIEDNWLLMVQYMNERLVIEGGKDEDLRGSNASVSQKKGRL